MQEPYSQHVAHTENSTQADSTDSTDSFVYVLTNEAMPGLVKIGITGADDPEHRAAQLYSTGVPLPFDVEYAALVPNAREVERALHNAFRGNRVNPKREFFRISPDQAIGILSLFDVQDVTSEVASSIGAGVTEEERRAVENERSRRPALNFEEMQIPMGSVLVYAHDESVKATVVEARKVEIDGQVVSLSPATRDLLGRSYYVKPTQYWAYNGRSLQEIYDETYTFID